MLGARTHVTFDANHAVPVRDEECVLPGHDPRDAQFRGVIGEIRAAGR